MLTMTLDPSRQLAVQRPVESALPPPPRPLSAAGFGSLAEHQSERPEAGLYERNPSSILAGLVIVGDIGSVPGSIVELID